MLCSIVVGEVMRYKGSVWNLGGHRVSSKMACGFCSHEMCGHGGQVYV